MNCTICYQEKEKTSMAKYVHHKNNICRPNICYTCANNWYEKSYSCPNCRDFVMNIEKRQITMDLSLNILILFCSFSTYIINSILKYVLSVDSTSYFQNMSYYSGILLYCIIMIFKYDLNDLRNDMNTFLIFKLYILLMTYISVILFNVSIKYNVESFNIIFVLVADIFYIFYLVLYLF